MYGIFCCISKTCKIHDCLKGDVSWLNFEIFTNIYMYYRAIYIVILSEI